MRRKPQMYKILARLLFLGIIVVSATYWFTTRWVDGELKAIPPKTGFIRELTDDEKNKLFLYEEVLRNGLSPRDFFILREIATCESSWKQSDNGKVIVSKGNIGLFQINFLAHHKTYEKMGLDVFNAYDNIRYAVFLYKRNGISDWQAWSGHCFLPKIQKFLKQKK
jgi:hypothetical protein